MVKFSSWFSILTIFCFITSPLLAGTREKGINLGKEEATSLRNSGSHRSRSHTSPVSSSNSSSREEKKNFFAFLRGKGKKQGKDRKSSLLPVTHHPESTSSTSSSAKQPLSTASLYPGVLNKLKSEQEETEKTLIQAQQSDFPPKTLSSDQIHAIMLAKYRYDKRQAKEPNTEKEESTRLDETTSASIKTTDDAFKRLLLRMNKNYNSVIQNTEEAKRIALNFLNNFDTLSEEEAISIDPGITAVYLCIISPNPHGSTATAEKKKGHEAMSFLYHYNIKKGDTELGIPFIDGGNIVEFACKVPFNFTKHITPIKNLNNVDPK